MSLPDLHRRACQLTDEILALEETTGFEKTLKDGTKVLGFTTYEKAIDHQIRVRERGVLIDQLRRGIAAVPEPEFMA